jgi:DNA-binding transcriptional LysR family regulator
MELRQLRQFVMLAETLNFRRTAEALNIAQPPLSVSIRKLEEEIGTRLFDRSKSGVQLTESGRAALPDAQKALFHGKEVARIARATALGLDGRLRIGFVGSAKYALLPRLLPIFRAQYPQVALELSERSNGDIIAATEAGAIDVGIVRVPFALQTKVRFQLAEDVVFVAAIPIEHRLAAQKTVSLADIAAEPFVHYTVNSAPGLHMLTMLLFNEKGLSPRVSQEAVQVETVICLVESGLGLALVPSIAANWRHDKVVFRPLEDDLKHARVGLAIAFEPNYEPLIARRFRELASQPESTLV